MLNYAERGRQAARGFPLPAQMPTDPPNPTPAPASGWFGLVRRLGMAYVLFCVAKGLVWLTMGGTAYAIMR